MIHGERFLLGAGLPTPPAEVSWTLSAMQDHDRSNQTEGELITPFQALRMDKTAFSVVPLGDESSDREYWWAQDPLDRLEALEWMRQVVYGYDPISDRIQRVLEVVERPPS